MSENMTKKKEKKNVIEVKFNSKKEKIFIFLRKGLTVSEIDFAFKLIKNLEEGNPKIWLLPKDLVDSVKVIKDVKKNRVKKRRNS